jgi:voltage-gated potassium channel Kch
VVHIEGGTGAAVRLLRRRRPQPDRYGLLLGLLVLGFLVSAYSGELLATVVRLLFFMATLHLALRTSMVRPRVARLVLVVTLAGSVLTIALSLAHRSRVSLGVLDVWVAVVLLIAVLVIVRRVLSHPVVSLQTILGALSAYLVLGLMFAAVYGALGELGSRPFFASGAAVNQAVLQYFSFTTLTTLGYGDYTAATDTGRVVAVIEALGGQIFLVTLVARLVSAFPGVRRDRRPQETRRRSVRVAGRTPARRPARRRRIPAGHGRHGRLRH